MKPFIYDYTLEELQSWMKENGEPAFRAGQLFEWLYVKRVKSFEDMSNLSKALRQKLEDSFQFVTLMKSPGLNPRMAQLSFCSACMMTMQLRRLLCAIITGTAFV